MLSTLLVAVGFSQKLDRKNVDDRSHAAKTVGAKSVKPRVTVSETFTSLTIDPGASLTVDSAMDYSTSDVVRVSLRSMSGDLSPLQMLAYWSDPLLGFYNATQAIDGSTFVNANSGGGQFVVYGPQFRLVLTNTGTTTINLDQLMIFAPIVPQSN